jgi:signal transduction histidine kinase
LILALVDPEQHLSPSGTAVFFLAYGAYNLTITVLLALGLFVRAVPAFTLIADTLGLYVLLFLSGGIDSPFFFVPLFPILVAALRFGWWPALLVAVSYSVGYVVGALLAWETGQELSLFFQPALVIATYLLAGIVGGVVSARLATAGGRWDGPGGRPAVPEHIQMIYELASNLSASLNYQRVLEAILDISRLGFDELGLRIGESVGLVLLYDQDGYLAPAAHRNLITAKDETRRIKGKSGIVDQAIGTSRAVIGVSPAEDPELKIFESLNPCQSMICVPLRAGFETFGCVLFASVRSSVYTSEHIEVLAIFCNQATIALQNASLYQSLREERDKIVDKEEQARHKLARDLHDGPTQDVAAIAMRLNFARLLVERDPGRAKAELARLEDLAHRTVKEIRSMLFTLRPVILETEGLVAALNQHAGNLQENDGLPIEIDAERYVECLDTEAQGVVFAIIEEAVNNAKKHAQAMHIWVRLAVQGDVLIVQVADDGRGFDVEAVEGDYASRGSLGMINLKERAGLVGGTINIDSTPGQGTRITLLVPIAEEPI